MSHVQYMQLPSDRGKSRSPREKRSESSMSYITSSKSKIISEDSYTESSISKKYQKEMPPIQPPPSKIIKINEMSLSQPKKRKRVRKKSTKQEIQKDTTKNVDNGEVGPAPQLIFNDGNNSERHHHRRRGGHKQDTPTKKSPRRRENKMRQSDSADVIIRKNVNSNDLLLSEKSKIKRETSFDVQRSPLQSPSKGPSKLLSTFNFDAQTPPHSPTKIAKQNSIDDLMCTILTIPTELPELPPQESQKQKKKDPPLKQITNKRLEEPTPGSLRPRRLPEPNFKQPIKGDGLSPLITIAETNEFCTNAFNEEKYNGKVFSFKGSPREEIYPQPIKSWYKFQVPLVPRVDDFLVEKEATRIYDIGRLLHQSKCLYNN